MIWLFKQNNGFERIICNDKAQIENNKDKLIEVTNETYYKLEFHQLMWVNGELAKNPNYQEYFNEQAEKFKKAETQSRINQLKNKLAETDYRAIKYAEGEYTEEQYAPYKKQRQEWRDEINRLEVELGVTIDV